jgi:hypothetical protein
MSMVGVKWILKDGFSEDPATWCGNNLATGAEIDNDWTLIDSDLPYNANTKTLTAIFSRELIGSTSNDLTYKIGTKYDYKLTYGVWPSGSTTDLTIGETSSNVLDYLPVGVMTASYDDTFAKYLTGISFTSALLVASTLY